LADSDESQLCQLGSWLRCRWADHDAGRQNCPCDAVILLIGLVVGCQPADWPPELPLRSYRQFGYDIAAELPKAVFRLLAVKDAKLDAGEPATDPQQAPQYSAAD
jgi:hypothetical protein